MKFWIGYLLGAVTAAAIVSNLDDRQRKQLAAQARSAVDRVRRSDLGTTLRDDAGVVADAASRRVTAAAEAATERIVDTVGPAGPAAATG